MIVAKIFRNSEGKIFGYDITGHANTAPHGQDIVCAGVAALSQTAVLGLERHLGRRIELDIASGKLAARLIDPPDALTDAVLESMVLGLREISSLYPKSVRLSEYRR
ncbi:MAG: ribosomal-processing cysteine protease Prp [Negativicutes bacterium]|nr:ribosomal-processing cysteine protease Prp [Negativicutes bacterium]